MQKSNPKSIISLTSMILAISILFSASKKDEVLKKIDTFSWTQSMDRSLVRVYDELQMRKNRVQERNKIVEARYFGLTLEEKEASLLKYFNMNNTSEIDNFFNFFIENMKRYEETFTKENLIKIFYIVSKMSLEEKIDFVKLQFDLTDEQIYEYTATHMAEGTGHGKKYVDVFASSFTALNRAENALWQRSTENVHGKGTGDNIYYVTANKVQFSGYKNKDFYEFYGDESLLGFTAAIDAVYVGIKYNMYMHDFTCYNLPGPGESGTFVATGNVYYREEDSKDRIVIAMREISTPTSLVLNRKNKIDFKN